MKLEHAFEVPASPDQTWLCCSTPSASCPACPARTLKEVVDEGTWKAEMGVKLGPVGMQFLVNVKLLERERRRPRGEARRERARHARQGRGRGHGRLAAHRPRRRRHARRDGHRPAVLRPGGPARAARAWCRTCPTSSSTSSRTCIKAQLSAVARGGRRGGGAGAEADLRASPWWSRCPGGFDQTSLRPWRRPKEGGGGVKRITVTVNGVRHEADVEERELLVYFLREGLGLTGTNVGCDTSSCGTCTIHVDGESVKSCTLLAVQADGAEVTTIEGLATNGELHPMQASFQEHHGLQCGYCTPGMIMAAVGLPEGEPQPDRGRDPPRARGQPLPLHRLPQHRQGRRGRGELLGGGDGDHRAAARSTVGSPQVRKEDPELITGRSRYVDDITVPGMLWAHVVRSPFAHARINGVDVSKALAMEGCVAAFSGADLASEWAAPAGLRLAGHRRHQDERALAARQGQGALRRRRRRRGGGRDAAPSPRTPPSWSRSTGSRCRP